MKKTLLAATVLSTLSLTGAANAAFVSGPFNGELTFAGTIAKALTGWSWEIPADAVTAFNDISLIDKNGVEVNGNTEFVLTTTPKVFFHGHMNGVTAMGGPGLAPVVTFGGKVFDNPTSGSFPLELPLEIGEGSLSIEIGGAAGWAATEAGVLKTTSANESSEPVAFDAQNLLRSVPGFIEAYPNGIYPSNFHIYVGYADDAFTDPNLTNHAQTRSFAIQDAKLVVPSSDIPTEWSVTMPITVAYK